MIVGVIMDVSAIMVECTLVMIVTIQVSHGDVSFGWAPHAIVDCSQPSIFLYCYLIFERAESRDNRP